ncbi:T9SS type A sorting domain-containing protein [Sediminibacterium roseum]|uniref:T9SS type A sorting domain-containing protein n=1 Tax=Sediminibacterium roseum TaxID=1978412 RepID=A0ABW9ZT42_9BACT|nr:YDG domain-containing protein [Sediminibacterium roseum]NCI49459.1 T9SS type A sorting domain-containing protein [Sediminibacterium roseum]
MSLNVTGTTGASISANLYFDIIFLGGNFGQLTSVTKNTGLSTSAGVAAFTATVLNNTTIRLSNGGSAFVNTPNNGSIVWDISATAAATPTLVTTGTLNAFATCAGTASSEQSFTVSGADLTANLVVTPPTGFEVSTSSGTGFGSSVSLTPSSGSVSTTTIYTRMSSSATGTPSGNITVSSTGATSKTVAVSGTANVVPTITLGTISSVAGGATSFNLPYSTTTGSPDQYSVATGSPNAMGSFAAVTNQALGASPVAITIPSPDPGTYNFDLSLKNSTTGCVSATVPFTLNVTTGVSSINRVTASRTNATSLSYTVTFAHSVTGVDASDFTLVKTGTADGTVGTPTGSGTTWTVPVTGISGDGNLRLDFTSPSGITPAAGASFTSGQTYSLDHTAPATPTGFSVAAGDQQNVVKWSANIDADLSGYNVYGGTTSSPNTLLTTVTSGTVFTHTGLTNGTTYYYRISAADDLGNESAKTSDASAVPKAAQTITFGALAGATYGDADIDPGATASSGLTVSYQSSNLNVATIVSGKIHITGAGTTTITASQPGNTSYLAATDKTQDIVVAKKDITITLNATPTITKVYNGSTTALLADANFTFNTVVGSDVLTATGTANYDTKDVGTGKTITVNSFVLGGAQRNSYNVTTTSATVNGNITAKPVTLTLNAAPTITKVYDASLTATLAAGNYALSGIESGDAVTVSGTAAYDTKDAGNSKTVTVNSFVLAGAQKDNYTLSTTTANVAGVITTKPVSVSLNASPLITKTYNAQTTATLASSNFSITGIESGDVVTVSGTSTYDTKDAGSGKTVTAGTFVLAGAQKDNYSVSNSTATTTGNIITKNITVSLNATPVITKAYNGTTTATLAGGNYSLSGIESGDAVTVSGTATYDTKEIGTGKTITVNGFALAGAQKDNYNLTTTTATVNGNITVKSITLTLSATPTITKTYDGSVSATLAGANYALTGVESGDAVTVSGTASYDTKDAGNSKTITVNSFVLAGAQKDNYTLATTTANVAGVITTKAVTVSLNASPAITKVYDASTTAALASSNFSLTGIESGDAVTVSATANYDTKNAGAGKTITAGSFVLAGAQKDNYNVSTTTATVTGAITAKPITATLNASPAITKPYDGNTDATTAASNFSLAGVDGGDIVTISGTATYNTKTAGTGKIVTVSALALAGAQKDNYTIAAGSLTTTGTITAKPVTVTAEAKSKTYGATDPALTYTTTPALVTGDAFSGALTRTAGENFGTYSILIGSLALSTDYAVSYVPADLTIGKKTINVTAEAKNKTYGDADPALTYTFTPALVSGDAFSGALTRAAGEHFGTHTIQQGSLSLSSNYTISYTSADLTIGKKTINVTAGAKNKAYADADPVFTYTSTPALVTGDAFTGTLSRTPGEALGTYPIQQGTLALSSDYTINYTPADLTIGKKTINVSADAKTKVYGDADPSFTYTFTPALATGDAFSGALSRTPGEGLGPHTIDQGTLSLPGNYTIAYTSANLNITVSPNANLKSIVLSTGLLAPVFNAATTVYTATVGSTVTSIKINPTPELLVSTIRVNGTIVPGGTFSGDIPVSVGNNAVTIAVTAQDGIVVKNYYLNVVRPVSNNASLTSLVVSAGAFTPAFDPDVRNYTIAIAENVSSVAFTATAAEIGSTIKANNNVVTSGAYSVVPATGDVSTLSLDVTAADGVTNKNYVVSFVKPVTTWSPASGDAWTTAGNWTNGVPDNTKRTVITNLLPSPVVRSNQTIANITVNSGAAVQLSGADLRVTGNMVNNGTFTGTGNLVFNGTAAQGISGSGSMHHFTGANANGIAIAPGTGNTQHVTGVLTMNAGTLTTGDNLVLKSTAAGTASVAPLAPGTVISGQVTAERWMQAQRGYRTLAHPFNTPLPLSQLTDDFAISGSGTGFVSGLGYSTASVSYYDSSANTAAQFKKPLSNAPNTTSTLLWSVGRGILALVRGKGTEGLGGTYPNVNEPSAFAANATGVLNQGTLEYKLGANVSGTSFNLVGNPYAAPINIKLLKSNGNVSLASNSGANGVGATIYVYNPFKNAGISSTPSQEVRGGLDAYTNDGTTDIIIPAFGAFFVQSKAPGNVISFTENAKATSASPLAVMGGGAVSKLTLSVENSRGSWDDIKLRWDNDAHAQGDDRYDGEKLANELLDAYTLSSDDKKLCIDSRSDSFNREEIIPIGITTKIEGEVFRFRIASYNMPSNVQLTLRDKFLGTETPLNAVNDSYSFTITSDSLSKGDNRFELGVGFKKTTAVQEDVSADVKIVPNPFRDELVVQLGVRARSAKQTHVRLLDMTGRVVRVFTAAPNAAIIRVYTADLAPGVYFAELENDAVKVTRQAIKQK